MKKLIILFLIISTVACSNDNKLDDTFKKLQPTLESAIVASLSKTEDAMYNLERKVDASGNPSEGLEKIKRTGYLMQKTKHLLSFIDSLKTSLKKIPNTQDKASVKKIFIAQGMGKVLENSLNEYVLWLNEEHKDLEIQPFYSLTQDSLKRDFVEDNFGQATVSEAMIFLARLQVDVIRFNQEILKLFGADEITRTICCGFGSPVRVFAKSDVVKQGEDYEADMCIRYSTCGEISIRISKSLLNGKPLKLNNNHECDIILPNTSEGLKNWEAIFKIRRHGESDTTFVFQKTYQVFPKNQ